MKFVINGEKELSGEIEVKGSKNAAGPIISATILTDQDCIISNIPRISDILNLLDIVSGIGKKIEWLDDNTVKISGSDLNPDNLDFDKISKARVSVLLLGALIARFDKFKFARPGGDKIGIRPIKSHIEAFKSLGVNFEEKGDYYYITRGNLRGSEIVLPEFSVTATENVILAATLTPGKTVVKGVAQEPHVKDLVDMLNQMGANIKLFWSNEIHIGGVEKLSGVEHRIISDTNEAGTFVIMGACCGKNLKITNINPKHLDLFFYKLKEMGVELKIGDDSVEVSQVNVCHGTNIQALPYPGFPTDILPLIVPLMTKCGGKSRIHDPLYENRLNYVHQLRKMGADIEIVDPHRAFIFGPTPLKGLCVESLDIRAGASLVLAGLMASGETTILNIDQIDRGHEKLEERLIKIGADIKRI